MNPSPDLDLDPLPATVPAGDLARLAELASQAGLATLASQASREIEREKLMW